MKKIFTLAAAVLFTAGMFAAVESETFDQAGAANNTDLVKTASTLPGTFIAGQGGGAITGYEPTNKGIKLRAVQDACKVTVDEVTYGYAIFNVHSGYAVRSIQMLGTTNGDNAATVKGIYVDVDTEDLAGSLAGATNKLAADFVFPNKSTNYATSDVVSTDASSNIVLLFDVASQTQLRAIFVTEYERTATCNDPTIAWNVEPVGGVVGAADFTASVNVPAGQTVTWESSVPEAATVENGVIHFVAPGVTTITAKYTYVGEEFCNVEASISKEIVVPISFEEGDSNDAIWYYPTAIPASKPDNGLNYKETTNGNGLFGVKLNSDGYAWFAKEAVAGKLRVGAYYRAGSAGAYEVDVFACDAEGNAQGDALGTLSVAYAGSVSEELDIAADVAGLRIVRKTSQEGVLYFIEFRGEGGEPTAIDNTKAAVKAVKVVRNGHLFIEKNGVVYNAQGAIVK